MWFEMARVARSNRPGSKGAGQYAHSLMNQRHEEIYVQQTSIELKQHLKPLWSHSDAVVYAFDGYIKLKHHH